MQYQFQTAELLFEKLEFMNQECIFVQKHTKKEEQLMDLRPYIFSYSLSSNEFSEKNRI